MCVWEGGGGGGRAGGQDGDVSVKCRDRGKLGARADTETVTVHGMATAEDEVLAR